MAVILTIDFEEEDFSDFDSTTGVEDLSVIAGAAMVGTYGMNLAINDVDPHYGSNDITVGGATELRARFYIDPNNYTQGGGSGDFRCFLIRCDGTYSSITDFVFISLGYDGSNYDIFTAFGDDADVNNTTANYTISDDKHWFEIYVKRETSDGAGDGIGRLYIDDLGTPKESITNLENFNIFPTIDEIRFGGIYGIDSGSSGNIFFDDLIVRDDGTEIGPAGVALEINIAPDNIDSYTQGVRVK